MSALALDANGLPVGHADAHRDAARELSDVINELPESVYHLGPTDAEWAAERMLERYLISIKRTQNGGVQ